MTIILAILLGLALLGYVPIIVMLFRARKSPPPVPKYDATASDLLHNLTRRGGAVLRLEILDPESLFIRR